MQNSLFRSESVAYLSKGDLGKLRLISPPGSTVITSVMALLLLLGLYFLFGQPFARKASVSGYLHANVMRVSPEKNGTLTSIYVNRGEPVRSGDPIAEIQSRASQPEAHAESYDILMAGIESQIQSVRSIHQQNTRQLAVGIHQHKKSILRQEEIRVIRTTRLKRLKDNLEIARPLFSQGYLSRLEWGGIQDDFLFAQQELEELEERMERSRFELAQKEIERQNLDEEHVVDLLQIDEKKTHLSLNRDKWLADSRQVIYSPVDGQVATIFKHPGEVVVTKESILSLMPDSESIQARLLIPGHSIGFIQPGQHVSIRYDTFPHLKFGSHEGRVLSVSSHQILPQDLPLEVPGGEIYFLVAVELPSHTVSAYGIVNPLRPGMTLTADIILDARTLFEWLFEPLLASGYVHV